MSLSQIFKYTQIQHQQNYSFKVAARFIQDIKLTDLSGIVIQEQSDLRPRGQFEMSLEGLTSGVYVVYLTDELGLTYQKKIIKID